jgi:hypothetical protein
VHSWNENGLGLYKDEMSGFYGAINQYKGGKGTDESFWLESFSNGSYIVNRKNAEPISIDNIFVNIIGTIQPDVLKEIVVATKDSGFADRFLYTEALKDIEMFSRNKVEKEILDSYELLIDDMCEDISAMKKTVMLGMNDECLDLLVEFQNEYQILKTSDDIEKSMVNYLSKLITYLGRFVLILAIIESYVEQTTMEVKRSHVENAKRICDYFFNASKEMWNASEKAFEAEKLVQISGAMNKTDKATALINAGIKDRALIISKSGISKANLSRLMTKLNK